MFEIVEQGQVALLEGPEGAEVILSGKGRQRRIVFPSGRAPGSMDVQVSADLDWGWVSCGEPEGTRIAGGRYAFVSERKGLKLAWSLDDVDPRLFVDRLATYDVSVRNPHVGTDLPNPPGGEAVFPRDLDSRFTGRLWERAADLRVFDVECAQLLFIRERWGDAAAREILPSAAPSR